MKIRVAVPEDVREMFEVRTSVRENHMSLEELAEIGVTRETLPEMLCGTGRGWVALDSSRRRFAARLNSGVGHNTETKV